jgi:hypothetical protein
LAMSERIVYANWACRLAGLAIAARVEPAAGVGHLCRSRALLAAGPTSTGSTLGDVTSCRVAGCPIDSSHASDRVPPG